MGRRAGYREYNEDFCLYGSSAGHLMIDVTNGESWTVDDLEQNFDMNNPKTTEQMQTLLFWASDAYFEGINQILNL